MRRVIVLLTVSALMALSTVFGALPAFATGSGGGSGGDDCNSTNSNSQLVNANIIGNQQQGSCNEATTGVNVDLL